MKKFFSIFLVLILLSFAASKAQAIWTPPFPPFSEDGNPNEKYLFDEVFPLLHYIPSDKLEVFENRDRSRNYEDLEVCAGDGADRRDKECNNQGDGCTGGEVDLCSHDTGSQARTAFSKAGSCKLHTKRNTTTSEDSLIEGHCEYLKTPKITSRVKGTDFSGNPSLAFPKIQSEQYAYDYVGGENAITSGSMILSLTQYEKSLNQLSVLVRANQTKETKSETGHWPLGWVDWGYTTPNGKTLIDIYSEIPSIITESVEVIIEENNRFYLSGGELNTNPKVAVAHARISTALTLAKTLDNKSSWITDLDQTPLYPPSYRQGYVRSSICVWDRCCLTPRCPLLEEELIGNKKGGLYFDTSISQTYNAALQDLFVRSNLSDGVAAYKIILLNNPLARYLTISTKDAIPPKINQDLAQIIKGTCSAYTPWDRWLNFGLHMDYFKEGRPLGPNNTCPDIRFQKEGIVKETAGATELSGFSYLMSLIWGGKSVDEVDPIKYHLITVPDAMGQSIDDIQNPVYRMIDNLKELETIEEYNDLMTNIVEDDIDGLLAGKRTGPNNAKRFTSLYSCADDMYANQTQVNIKAYAMGSRPGCDGKADVPAGKCDGQLFAKLIEGTKYQETSSKGAEYFNTNIKSRLTPELMKTYAAAEKETGVPCEVLAGIHFVEADNNPDGSLVSGRKIGTPEPDAGGKVFHSLLETAKYAGDHLKGKIGGKLNNVESVITALSRYNGGGNSNCQAGYPYPIPYGGCPRVFEGEDDPYPTSFLDSKHNSMYLLYCADYTACAPQIFERPGSFTVALNVYNSITKSGYSDADLPEDREPDNNLDNPPGESTPHEPFFPKSCGPGSLSTALGCLPYTKDSFVSTILTFLVGIAGAIALVVMLISTIQLMTSSGDTKKIQSARDLFTSAIAGLLFLIFAVSLLRLIAGDIIKLPGF